MPQAKSSVRRKRLLSGENASCREKTSSVRRKRSLSGGNENRCRKKVIDELALCPVSDTGMWPNVRMLQRRPVQTISDPGEKQMQYRVMLCGGLLATAVLLSFPHASSALPAAPSALLPAAHGSDLIIVRGGGGRGGGGGHARGGGGGAGFAHGGGAAHARSGNGKRNANVNRTGNRNVNRNGNAK